MKQIRQCALAFALLLAAFGSLFGVQALGVDAVSNFSIEQTYVNVPELDIFLYALDGEGNSISPTLARAAGVEATLGNYKLDTSNISMAAEPVCYIFLLDNSRSMTEDILKQYKQAILQVARTCGEKDQIVVYTMGGTPKQILGESSTLKDIYHTLQGVKTVEEHCNLLPAAKQVMEDVNTNYQSLAPRKALMICTSGIEAVSNPAMVAGLSSSLSNNLNMALFAFAASESADRLSLLNTMTNGKVIPCDTSEIVDVVRAKQTLLANALQIKTTVPANQGGEKLDELTLSVPSLGSAVKVSTTVYMGHSQARPAVTGAQVTGRNTIQITFNQAVDNADKPRCYTIQSEDAWSWQVPVKAVAVSQDGRTATLTTGNLYSGSYSLRLNKVASRMTAANQSDKTKTLFAISSWPHDQAFYINRFRLPGLVLLALLLVLAFRAAAQSRKDRASEAAAEVQHLLTGQAAPVSALPKRWLTLFVKARGSLLEKRYATLVEGSVVVGSDEKLCDICLEDHRVKPQHCMIWVEGEELYLRALDKSTPVFCNKARIADAHQLHNGDVLNLGRTTIQVVL
ncbi:MAG: FHA domain-containing protein [Gemmiger sp.]|nr:FHA domain-containing protein [Gemmiger sp.]